MKRLPITLHLNQRIAALICLLFCGYLEVLGTVMVPAPETDAQTEMEWVEATDQGAISTVTTIQHILTTVPLSATYRFISSSFSATLRSYASALRLLIRDQQFQYLQFQTQYLEQAFLLTHVRIDRCNFLAPIG